jgi:paraquat-inducible protein B
MAEQPDDDDLPKAAVTHRKRLRISIIWIIPVLAALVAIGIAIQRLRAEGPTITIVLHEANGVEAGKTESRYGAEGEGPSIYLSDPEGNVVELKGPPGLVQ